MKKFVKGLVAALAAVVLLQVPVQATEITPAYTLKKVEASKNTTPELLAAIAKALESAKKTNENKILNETIARANALISEKTLNMYKEQYEEAVAKEAGAINYYNEMVNLATYNLSGKTAADREKYAVETAKVVKKVNATEADKYGLQVGNFALQAMMDRYDVVAKEKDVVEKQLKAVRTIKTQVAGFVLLATDVAGVKKYAEELDKMEDDLHKKDQKLDQRLIDMKDGFVDTHSRIKHAFEEDTFKAALEKVAGDAKQDVMDAKAEREAAELAYATYKPFHDLFLSKLPTPDKKMEEKPANKDDVKGATTKKLPSTGAIR